mmetsp:Transcript_72493/g.170487  ORF Transcript_72493/g.170487 Transcript_72493/m.170487 type:complete len:120 (+) Transcript_72493:164-523(+)
MAYTFQKLELGPVVGTRTWGGVIGNEFPGELVDGTTVGYAECGLFFQGSGYGGIENRGVAPDVQVEVAPQDFFGGKDPQLDVAIERALAMLTERPRPPPPTDRAPRPVQPDGKWPFKLK